MLFNACEISDFRLLLDTPKILDGDPLSEISASKFSKMFTENIFEEKIDQQNDFTVIFKPFLIT